MLCDEEGNDIHIDALTDRYYQNPEKYFNTKTETSTEKTSPDDSFSKGQNGVVLQQNVEKDVKSIESESQDSNKTFVGELSLKRQYSDFLVDGIPIWQKENRGMTAEEAEAYKDEVAKIGRDK